MKLHNYRVALTGIEYNRLNVTQQDEKQKRIDEWDHSMQSTTLSVIITLSLVLGNQFIKLQGFTKRKAVSYCICFYVKTIIILRDISAIHGELGKS